jgi:hypothetical protein
MKISILINNNNKSAKYFSNLNLKIIIYGPSKKLNKKY